METFTVGRAETDVILDDEAKTVSKLHAELTVNATDGEYYLVDCGSSNGTFLKREGEWRRIKQETVSKDDLVRFGSSTVRLRDLVARLPARPPAQTTYFELPLSKTILQPFRNTETGGVEYR